MYHSPNSVHPLSVLVTMCTSVGVERELQTVLCVIVGQRLVTCPENLPLHEILNRAPLAQMNNSFVTNPGKQVLDTFSTKSMRLLSAVPKTAKTLFDAVDSIVGEYTFIVDLNIPVENQC